MRKIFLHLASLVLALFITTGVSAQITQVPNIMTAPVVLHDEGGNVLTDGTYTLSIALKDASGNTLYSEEQNVTVTNGVAPIIIGNGYAVGSNQTSAAGGVTWDLLNVDGDVTVEILVDGQSTVQRIATLASQPYSLISNYALDVAGDSISSAKIVDGSITQADLSQELQDQLSPSVVDEDGDLVSLGAEQVTVDSSAGLNNSGGSNVKQVLMDLDSVIDNIRNLEISQLSDAVDAINSNYVSQSELSNYATLTALSSKLDLSGGTMTGDLDMGENNITNVGTVDGVDLSQLGSTYATDTELADAVDAVDLSSRVSKIGDSMSGDLTMNANIVMGTDQTVDGVDVSDLEDRVDQVNPTDGSGVPASMIPQNIRPFAYGIIDTQDMSNPDCQGYNIDSGSSDSDSCRFSTSAANDNFTVVISGRNYGGTYCSDEVPYVSSKSTSGFNIYPGVSCTQTELDFIVYSNQ